MIRKIETADDLKTLVARLRAETELLQGYEFVHDAVESLVELTPYGRDRLDDIHSKMEDLFIYDRASWKPEWLDEIERLGYELLDHVELPQYFLCVKGRVEFVPARLVEDISVDETVEDIRSQREM